MEKNSTAIKSISYFTGKLLEGLRAQLPSDLSDHLKSSMSEHASQAYFQSLDEGSTDQDSSALLMYYPQYLTYLDKVLGRRFVAVESFESERLNQFYKNYLNKHPLPVQCGLAHALNALSMFNCFLEFQLETTDFADTKAATQRKLILLQRELRDLASFDQNEALNEYQEGMFEFINDQQQRHDFSEIQRAALTTLFEMIESYKYALTDQYRNSVLKYGLSDTGWAVLHQFTENLKLLPTREHKGKLYYLLTDINAVFEEYLDTHLEASLTEYQAVFEQYSNVICRMQDIHNLPLTCETKAQYMAAFAKTHQIPLADHFFEVYLLMENQEYLERIIRKCDQDNCIPPAYVAMQYLYQNEKFRTSLTHLGSLLDWNQHTSKLYAA